MEVYEIEKIQSFKRLGVTVECMTAYDNTLLICIRGGQLLEYKTRRVADGARSKQRVRLESKTHSSFSCKPVTEIHAVPECGLLLSLSDSMLHVYDLYTLEFNMTLTKSKGTTLIALDIKEKSDERNLIQTGATLKICAAIGRKLQLWKWKNKEMTELQADMSLCKAPRALVWSKNILFVGFKDEYFMIKVNTEEVRDLFNVGSSQKDPVLSKLDHQTVLVGYENKSVVFDNSLGLPRKDYYIMWSSIPAFIEYDPPYVVAVLPKHIEVRSFKPSVLLQTLDIKNVRFICRGSEFLYVESHNTVMLLVPKSVPERISFHMNQDQFEVALQLVNRSEGSEDDREGLEQKIKCRHAVHLFCQHKYKDAMDIFLGLDTDPSHVVGLYPQLLPSKLKSSLTFPEDIPRLEGGDFEKGLIALIDYLNDKRKLIQKQEELKPLSPIMEGNVTLQTKDQVFSVIDTTLLKCYLNINEGLIAPLLRSADHRVHVKEAEKVLLKKQKFSELIILYQQHKMHTEALDMVKNQSTRVHSPLYGPDMTVHYLQGLGEENLPLIFKYSEWVLKDYPADGIKIFTDDDVVVQNLPRGHVLSFIEGISKDLAISYLEHVTYEWKDTTEELHFSLAKLLRDKVVTLYQKFIKSQPEGHPAPRAKSMTGQLGKFRSKLLYFLETSKFYDPNDVLMRFSTLAGFYEEKAILFGRLHRHEQSIGIYIMILQDPTAAEEHCRKYHNKDHKEDSDVYLALLKTYLHPPEPAVLGLSEYQYEPKPNHVAALALLEEHPTSIDLVKVYLALLKTYLHPPEPAVLGLSEYQYEPKPNHVAALALLEEHPTSIDLVKALEILPPEMKVRKLQLFLEASIQSCIALRNDYLIRKKMQFAAFLEVSEERLKYDNTHFTVQEEQNCVECHRRLGNSFLVRYPDGTVVHYGCCKDTKTQLGKSPSLASVQQLNELESSFSSREDLSSSWNCDV